MGPRALPVQDSPVGFHWQGHAGRVLGCAHSLWKKLMLWRDRAMRAGGSGAADGTTDARLAEGGGSCSDSRDAGVEAAAEGATDARLAEGAGSCSDSRDSGAGAAVKGSTAVPGDGRRASSEAAACCSGWARPLGAAVSAT